MVGNEQNLGPPYDSNTARENGKKGVVKTNAIRRKKKLMADVCRTFLALKPALSKDERKKLEAQGVNLNQYDMQAAAIYTQIAKAMKGDLQALVFLRDTSGEKPVDKTQSDMTVSIPQIIDDIGGFGGGESG